MLAPTETRKRCESARCVNQNENEQRAVGEILILAKAPDGFWEQGDDESAERRTSDRTDAADVKHGECKHHHVQPVDLWADKPDRMDEQRARNSGIEGGD